MVRHLSAAWIEALDEAVKSSAGLRAATAEVAFTVQQVVTSADGDVTWHLVVDHGEVAVEPGRADDPDLVFTQDRTTAQQIAAGELSAQAAFMVGRLRVGGDLTVLLANQEALAGLEDVFARVRAQIDPVEANEQPHPVRGRA
ncbi:MAG: hypothetical protein JWN46_3886 [Acidimicrobiales bacterium]|nr:hypothetical protein [Acidimicrobiales bacterium]